MRCLILFKLVRVRRKLERGAKEMGGVEKIGCGEKGNSRTSVVSYQ